MPEIKRQFERLALYERDVPPVLISGAGEDYFAQLYDISPVGAGLFISGKDAERRELPIRGQQLSLTIRLNKDESFVVSALVCHVAELEKKSKKGFQIGLTFVTQKIPNSERDDKLLAFSQVFRPLAYAEDPLLFQEFLHFQIEAYSPSEVVLRTSKSNRSLIPGQSLNLNCLLPSSKESMCKVRILKIDDHESDEGSYQLRCRWMKPSEAFKEGLAEFILIAKPNVSISEMKAMGWSVTHMQKAIRFRYVSSDKDMRAVLDLRLAASQHEGLWAGMRDSGVMLDAFDPYARQIMCIVGSKVVASARVIFNEGKRSKSEHASYGAKLPLWLWKEGFLEASQLCTHPDYRGADVFHFLLQHLTRITAISESKHLLFHSTESMVPVYQKLGAKNLKIRVEVPSMPGTRLQLLTFDCHAAGLSLSGSPLSYNVAFKKMSEFTAQQGLLDIAPHHEIYRRTIGMIEPIAQHIERKKRKLKK
ncbi:MAG: GNAT family N-acetyltransferase [Proteobacteria bacterium]|nr:MAG: GNAT family N-acetyltransferase [Pseudomonadota bacterium]